MNKRQYFSIAQSMDTCWLLDCVTNPSPYMSRVHVLIVRLALRKRGVR